MGDSLYKSYVNSVNARKEAEERNQIEYARKSKHRLASVIEKKMKTAFIGALHSFELEFSELWESGDEEDRLYFKEKWERCRREILDKGNNELRAAQSELDNYDIELSRRSYKFFVGGN